MTRRFRSLSEFWPYYLSEHREPAARRLHFLGTTGAMASMVVSTAFNPIAFPMAMAGTVALGWDAARRVEPKRAPLGHAVAMLALPTVASPIAFPAGVLWGYGCAWVGHFLIEKNRPATFQYPVWSLASDFKVWGLMARGHLWSGDPLEELGLEDPFEQVAAAK